MNNEKDFFKFLCFLVFATTLFFSILVSIESTTKLNTVGKYNDQLTERVVETERINRELTDTIGRCRDLCSEFEDSVSRNVSSTREAVELIEETRYLVQCIEVELNLWTTDSVYERTDSWLESQLNNEKEKKE